MRTAIQPFRLCFIMSLCPVLTQGMEALNHCSIPVLSLTLLAAFLLMLDIGLGVHCELISLLAAQYSVWLLPSQIVCWVSSHSDLLSYSYHCKKKCSSFLLLEVFWKFINCPLGPYIYLVYDLRTSLIIVKVTLNTQIARLKKKHLQHG